MSFSQIAIYDSSLRIPLITHITMVNIKTHVTDETLYLFMRYLNNAFPVPYSVVTSVKEETLIFLFIPVFLLSQTQSNYGTYSMNICQMK